MAVAAISRAPAAPASPVQWVTVAVAAAASVALLSVLAGQGWRAPVIFGLGAAAGFVLYHAAFGFAGAYRRLFETGDTSGLRAQLLMLATATALFAPVLAAGGIFGHPASGAVAPIGVQVAAGAFLFGVGMQLAGGCGSGTLFAVGGGSTGLMATLVAFCAGSFWASLDMGWWTGTPRLPAVVLGDVLGWDIAAITQIALLLALWWGLRTRDRGGAHDRAVPSQGRFLRGGWPLLWGAFGLALINAATLAVAGHPWSITWAFTLWGAKTAQAAGWEPAGSWFWSGDFPARALEQPVLADTTSIMDIGIVLGALAAAGAAGRYAPRFRMPLRSWAAAVIGGLLMGYGARIAYGCNIGAFFSGIASTSLHGWLWIAAALPGCWVGLRLRPLFGR